MGGVCLLFVVAIYGWLPRIALRMLKLPRTSVAQKIVNATIAVAPLAIGLGPLFVLIALIENPMAYVTDAGVMKENVFSQTPVSFTWGEIARVTCRLAGNGDPRWFTLVAADGRRIDLGSTGGVDFGSMNELFENQLGREVMHGCPRPFKSR